MKKLKKKEQGGPIDAGVDPKLLNATIFGKDRNMSTSKFLGKVAASDAKMKAQAAKESAKNAKKPAIKKMGGKVKKK